MTKEPVSKSTRIDRMVAGALAIEEQAALEAGTLGFMGRALVQATMPHSSTSETHFTRTNGDYVLQMAATQQHLGLPYGTIPRLVLAWMGTEAVRTQEAELVLGDSMSDFMRQLGLIPSGGRWGTIGRLKDQTHRLLSCAITCSYTGTHLNGINTVETAMLVADDRNLWWPASASQAQQQSLFKSTVKLSDRFFNEIINHPVPVDMRVLNQLKRSPMALDIYAWLTWRMSYLQKKTTIPWEGLQAQFGAGYPMTSRGKRSFKEKFSKHLKTVRVYYTEAHVEPGPAGLKLKPSLTHVGVQANKPAVGN